MVKIVYIFLIIITTSYGAYGFEFPNAQNLGNSDNNYYNDLIKHMNNVKNKVFPRECLKKPAKIPDACKAEYEVQMLRSMQPSKGEPFNESEMISEKCIIKPPKYPKKCNKFFDNLKKTKQILDTMPQYKWDSYIRALLNKHAIR